MNRPLVSRLVLLTVLTSLILTRAHAQVSDFEDGTVQGWVEGPRSPNLPENVGTGGNPGAFLKNISAGVGRPGSRWVVFNQTEEWTGNFIDAGVMGLELDLKIVTADSPSLHMRVGVEGPGQTRFVSTEAMELPADDQWHTLTFGLSADDLTQVGGRETLDTVLSDVGTVRILAAEGRRSWIGDFIAADVGLDNIRAIKSIEMPAALMAGDADEDLDFDQRDLVRVQVASRYLTGQKATWGEGDWNGGPGGQPGAAPAGDGVFNQLDIVAAQQGGVYLLGPYAAISPGGAEADAQTSIVYDPRTGEVSVDAPMGRQLNSINVDSAAGIFTGTAARNLGGSFDHDSDANIFKATFGGSFGSVSFGTVARTGLDKSFLTNDLTVVGSLSGGGALGNVDLVYVPEPAGGVMLFLAGLFALVGRCNRIQKNLSRRRRERKFPYSGGLAILFMLSDSQFGYNRHLCHSRNGLDVILNWPCL